MADGQRERNAGIARLQTNTASNTNASEEKKAATSSARAVQDQDTTSLGEENWRPGVFSQFPWMGIGALFGVLICSGCSLVILGVANHKSQDIWPKHFRPNSILTLLNSVANICFSIAIANGVAIAWWRRAMKGGTIENLHKSWSFSSSVKEAVLAGKAFNLIALAALTAKFAIIDGILMQSALSTYIAQNAGVPASINGFANTTFRASGQTLGGTFGDDSTNTIAYDVLKDLLVWSEQPRELPLNGFWGCDGLCFLQVPAAGFEFDCTQSSASIVFQPFAGNGSGTFNVGAEAPTSTVIVGSSASTETASSSANTGISVGAENPSGNNVTKRQSSSDTGSIIISNGTSVITTQALDSQIIFDVAFHAAYTDLALVDYSNLTEVLERGGRPSNVTMNITYSQAAATDALDDSCSGMLTRQMCTLRPAIYKYPVMIQNYTLGARRLQGVSVGVTEKSYFSGQSGQGDLTTLFNQSNKQQEGYEFVSYQNIYEHLSEGEGTSLVNTTLAGLQKAFEMYLGGQANATNMGTGGWQLAQGSNAQQYMSRDPGTGCAYWYENPLNPSRQNEVHIQSVVAAINQIMFAIYTNVTNNATENLPAVVQQYAGVEYKDSIHYSTNWAFAAGAIASTLVCVLFVLPVYWGWWQLGRKVTLGPFEIAHAFRSPMTAQAANGDIEELLKQVGQREVQYGHIVAGDAKGIVGVAEPEFVVKLPTKS